MKKDVIYVDIEDDITSIIEKVKAAEARIVALVPPKRIGVLQSVVNLKLLQKAATGAQKRVVLITNNPALASLAAGVAMPVAKNLQSKPEIAEVAALAVDDEDVINGEELPVGDLAATTPEGASAKAAAASEDAAISAVIASEQTVAAQAAKKAPKKANASKVPNFDIFRKKIFLFGGLGVLLVAFLVWAAFFAPRATIEIAARTNPTSINKLINLRDGNTLEPRQNITPYVTEQTKKTQSVDFTATGKKDVGEKATGTVEFSRQSLSSTEVPAGTRLTSESGLVFLTDKAVTIPASSISGPGCFPTACPGSATVGVTAEENGTKYNGADGSLSGAPSGASATFTDASSGGTSKVVTVVSQSDVNQAREDLKNQDIDSMRDELREAFDDDVVVIVESFDVATGDPSVSPAVGQEAVKGQVAVETTYTMRGIKRDDLKAIFDEYLKTQMSDQDSQKIYASGDAEVQFSEFSKADEGFEVRVQATGHIGPEIDEGRLKQQAAGKRAGEIRELIESVDGVQNVETNFWPFWVSTAPGADKITVKFIVENEAE